MPGAAITRPSAMPHTEICIEVATIAAVRGYCVAKCGLCEGSGVSLRLRVGDFLVPSDPCLNCLGGGRLWTQGGAPPWLADAELLELHEDSRRPFVLDVSMFDPMQRLDDELIGDLPRQLTHPGSGGGQRVQITLLKSGRVRFETMNGGTIAEVKTARETLQGFLVM